MKLTYDMIIHNPKVYQSCLTKIQTNVQDGVKPLAPIGGIYLRNDCLIWSGGKKNDYGSIQERIDGITYNRAAHIVSYMIYNKCEIPNGMEVNHLCQQPLCVERTHLILNTPSYNGTTAASNRQSVKPTNKTWIVTTPEVKHILVMFYVVKVSIGFIKTIFPNLSITTISDIIKGKIYKGVHADYYQKNFPFGRFNR